MMHTTNTRKQTDTPSGTKQFTVPSWQTAPAQPMKAAEASKKGGIMAKIETLEHAKHRAAASFARMTSGGPESAQATTRDEQDVLRARVDVLNVLMRNPDARLCLESSGTGARACVTYDRMRCEGGELELGPMQSTMSWAVRGGEDPVLNLLSAGDNAAGHASVVRGLLGLIRESAPKKDVLRGLHELLALPAPERLVLKSVGGINSTRQDHTRVVEGLGEAGPGAGPVPPLYRITWGALDLDVLEGWQNPSTNTAIRLSILDTAHQSVREAERTKAPAWSNVSYLQARIFHNDECHVLSLRPFWDSESCTVSHLQYKQSVFDDSGPERGILNLTQDARAVHAIPMGKILPIQAYVCLGAHRKSRLNEAQLNYVHAQGLLAHGLDVKLLPDAGTLLENASAGKMIAAKSTRVSAEKLDIMASSYHVADQVYTTISVVQYPPFGTQFEKTAHKPVVSTSKQDELPTTTMSARTRKGPVVVQMPAMPTQAGEWGDETDDTPMFPEPKRHSMGGARIPFVPNEDGDEQNLLYLVPREPGQKPFLKQKGSDRKQWFTGDLEEGQFFFVDGVSGSSFDINERFIMFDFKKTNPRYPILEQEAKLISRYMYSTFHDVWNPSLSFYDNLETNLSKATFTHPLEGWSLRGTPKQVYSALWVGVIRNEVDNQCDPSSHRKKQIEAKHEFEKSQNFWYTSNQDKWISILSMNEADDYAKFSKKSLRKVVDQGRIPDRLASQLNMTRGPPMILGTDQIPMPKTLFSARASTKSILRQEANPSVLHQLQHRIDALETRLSRVHQEENTKHLLEQVLDKLDSLETAV